MVVIMENVDMADMAVGDEFEGSPAEVSRYMKAVFKAGGTVALDGNTLRITSLPPKPKKAEPQPKAQKEDPKPAAVPIEPKPQPKPKPAVPATPKGETKD